MQNFHRAPPTRRTLAVVQASFALCAAALMPPGMAQAESFPSTPITFVVPFPPGGPTDTHMQQLKASGVLN